MENFLVITDIKKQELIIDEAYLFYKQFFLDRETRPKIKGNFIYMNESLIENKENGFWHISSIGEDETKFDSFPCNNDILSTECIFQCDSDHEDNFLKKINSIPCVYRANRIPVLLHVINLYNDGNKDNIMSWIQNKKGTSDKNLMIRYKDKLIDYILIFRINRDKKSGKLNNYQFVTAYPVVLKSYKRRFDGEYKEFLTKK